MTHKKRYLFVIMSGLGYLYPAIRIALILQKNNHSVLFVSTDEHSIVLSNYGIDHISMKSTVRKFLDLHRWGVPDNAINDFATVSEIINKYKPDVIITNPLAMVSFLIAEKYQIPTINIGFSEYLFPCKSLNSPTKLWRLGKFTEVYNSYCDKIGLAHIETCELNSPLIGTVHLLRSIPKLNEDMAIPDNVQYVGDLYKEPAYINIPLSRFILASKIEGRRIIYIQLGRLFADWIKWEKLLSILVEQPINYIVDVGRADYSTSKLMRYGNFFVSKFIPIGAIKEDIDFVICSGQTTSVISSIVHGKPILAIPHSADSIELTKRIESKEIAFGIYNAKNLTPNTVHNLFIQLNTDYIKSLITEYQSMFLAYTDDIIYEIIKHT